MTTPPPLRADLPGALSRALDDALDPIPASRLGPLVDRLITTYRSGGVATAPILRTGEDAAAYAAYRMPATLAAVRDAFGHAAEIVPDLAPRTMVDVGGGTGAAVWAAAAQWPSLREVTVLDGADPALALGRRLATGADDGPLRTAGWRRVRLSATTVLPDVDLVTACYLLGELDAATRAALVAEAARRGQAVAVVEPGTPAGHRRVLQARDELLGAGLTVVAPCPHDGPCPIATGDDWCHFAARVNRTSRHRRLKDGALGHEDEKFSYVVAVRATAGHAANRVVRHPVQRKGLVTLRLCTAEGGIADRPIPRSRKADHRAARDTSWGDAWPPPVPGG